MHQIKEKLGTLHDYFWPGSADGTSELFDAMYASTDDTERALCASCVKSLRIGE
ncbi:hypothetical protein [Mycolicibacterium insubricum]|uniref:hypothetical protein n=1 Tax=Mycolicibacterium insubricum TaxID=444597 RepID=UPI0013D378FF|nr:hypothetical protein [Mycolicibacterium insubricum]MCV7082846.1 hypothetical protein [Mycolicibacterium insubricum]